MSKEMIISVNGREKKIAILDNGRVSEFYIERGDEENAGIVGNIYKGRVMRVLPGMQSAFVDIGLERDAFLYVSDFFDEEEEIERIVMEKSKKSSPEDAAREATDKIQRARLEREKQMESAQEIAEPLAEKSKEFDSEDEEIEVEKTDELKEEDEGKQSKSKRGRSRRGKKTQDTEQQQNKSKSDAKDKSDEKSEDNTYEAGKLEPLFEMEDSNFERIVDEETTGDMFKDAYMQEAIIDQVRAIEFDMESPATAEVGSLIGSFDDAENKFERIADEDEQEEETPKPKRSRGSRGGKGRGKSAKETTAEKNSETETEAEDKSTQKNATRKSTASKSKKSTAKSPSKSAASKTSTRGKKKSAEDETLKDAEASVKESNDNAEMAVRRGGRSRRRTGSDSQTDTEETNTEKPNTEKPNTEKSNTRQQSGGRRNNNRRERTQQPTITDLLREGQEILVQIAKEPIAKKGARITSHIALPGRFLVYMPTIEHLGVSRKIESAGERARLRTLIQKIKQEEKVPSGGFIVRTAGIGIADDDLRQDAKYLIRTWLDIKKDADKAKSPALVHQDLDIIQRLLRDQLSDEFTAIRVDSEEEYQRIVEFINRIQPRLVSRVKLHTQDEPILEKYGVQEEVDKALKPRVWLKSGGYLVINQTEALVAIDVNTGKFVGKGNARLEDTITKTNMEAVDEIARQIRLRDLGGIIVLDLIDMEDRRNRHKVSQALQEALASDKSPNKVLSFNDFGLIIMTRKRVKQSLERTMCAPCDYCEGAGWIKSPQTICYEILDEARRLSKGVGDVHQTTLRVHPEVAKTLFESENTVLEEIEAYLGNVDVTGDKSVHQEQFDFAFV